MIVHLLSWNLVKFKQILSKLRVSRNLHNAVSQQPYVGVDEEEGGSGEWGGGCVYWLAHPPRWRRLCLYRLPFILISILSSLILCYKHTDKNIVISVWKQCLSRLDQVQRYMFSFFLLQFCSTTVFRFGFYADIQIFLGQCSSEVDKISN